MSDPDSPPADRGDLDALLDALEAANTSLRSMYQRLAEDPDRAGEYETPLRELHAKRLDLARDAGLAVLALKRAATRAANAQGDPPSSEVKPPRPPPPDEAPSSPDRASDVDIAQWTSAVQSRGFGRGLRESLSQTSAWPLVLHELMGIVGAPRDFAETVSLIEEIDALDAVSDDERQAQWARLPRLTQQIWLSMLVARTRAIQELPTIAPDQKARGKTTFRHCQTWSRSHNPGHINGFKLVHEPLDRSWSHDAQSYWDALSESLGEERRDAATPAASKKARPRPSSRGGEAAPALDPSWPLLSIVRERRALMVGGDPRERNRERLERAFAFSSLEWPPVDGPRAVDAVAERIRRGSYDLVLVLGGFVAHKQSDAIIEACKQTPVPWALVEWGYGVASVKLALDRFLGAHRGSESARAP